MNLPRWTLVTGWILLVLAGSLSYLIDGGLVSQPKPPNFVLLPTQLGPIAVAVEIPIEPETLGELPPDRCTFRVAQASAGQEGRLYVAYFERGRRWSGRPHDVQVCYQAQGWRELSARRLDSEVGVFWCRQFEKDGDRIEVVHWLQRPGGSAGTGLLERLTHRLANPRAMRQDVASIYWEFEAEHAPSTEEILSASEQMASALEELWS